MMDGRRTDALAFENARKTAIEVAIAVMKMFGLVYPERFTLVELDKRIAGAVSDLNAFTLRHWSKP